MKASPVLPASLLALALIAVVPFAAEAACPDSPPLISDATVRFNPGSAALPQTELQELRDIAGRARMRSGGSVCVYGSSGKSDGMTGGIAMERAEAVADELRRGGVPSFQIEVIPFTESDGLLGAMSSGDRVEVVLED